MTLLIEFYGGPASGKSTTSLALTSLLKVYLDQYSGSTMRAEYVSEAAKGLVWETGALMLGNQARLFGEQFRRLERLRGKVDIIVSDSPLWLCEFYGRRDLYPQPAWAEVIRAHYANFSVLPVLVNRVGRFESKGRVHDEAESAAAHAAIASIAEREYPGGLLRMFANLRTPFCIIEHLARAGDIPVERANLPFAAWYAQEISR